MKSLYALAYGMLALWTAGATPARTCLAHSGSQSAPAHTVGRQQAAVRPISAGSPPPTATLSPNGKWIAVTRRIQGHQAIYVMQRDGSHVRDLTGAASSNFAPAWSPDSQWIAFASDRNGLVDIYAARIDGGAMRRLTRHTGNNVLPGWSADGKEIQFLSDRQGHFTRWIMSAYGENQRQLSTSQTVQAAVHPSGDR